MPHPTIQDLVVALERLRTEWPDLCTNPRLKFDAEKEWVMQACEKTEFAMKAALGNIDATCAALRNVASVGVTIDPARKLAYILPRDSKMVYDLSYMGLLDLATASGALQWAQARIVHEKDLFELNGYDAPPTHKFKPFGKPEERGEVIGAYVVVKTSGGDYLTNAMPIDDINAIRDRSPAWKANQKGPWKTDWSEMAKKTTVKNAYKYWPRTEALDRAIHFLNTEGGQGIDTDGSQTRAKMLEEWAAKVKAATSGTEVATLWHTGRQEFKEDPAGYEEFKALIAAKNKELGVQPQPKSGGVAPGATPAPAPLAPGKATYAQVVEAILKAETYEALDATGPLIDGLGKQQLIDEANGHYNQRLEYLQKKLG